MSAVRDLGPQFAARAAAHDANDSFVADNFADLKKHSLFSVGIPAELGGGGASHAELCTLLRELAHACSSTALALSMHMHLLAATVWRWRQGHPVEPLLKRIVADQTVLISSGGSDWLDPSGTAEKVEGGFRITARKVFSSGCPCGDLLMTMAVYDDGGVGSSKLAGGKPGFEGDFIMEDFTEGRGLQVTISSQDQILETRDYDVAFVRSGKVDSFQVTTLAGRIIDLAYWGGPTCDIESQPIGALGSQAGDVVASED